MLYQLLEKSTYTSSSSVTLKSLMPVACKRNVIEAKSVLRENKNVDIDINSVGALDIHGNLYQLPVYYVFVFRKEIPILLFYLSKGVNHALDYLNVSNVITFMDKVPDIIDNEKYLYFQLSSKCVLQVSRPLFNKYSYIQSIVGGFVTVCTNRVTLEQLEDPKQWIKRIATPSNYEKGYSILKYFNRLLDETTKKILKVPAIHREDIYSLLRWIKA